MTKFWSLRMSISLYLENVCDDVSRTGSRLATAERDSPSRDYASSTINLAGEGKIKVSNSRDLRIEDSIVPGKNSVTVIIDVR